MLASGLFDTCPLGAARGRQYFVWHDRAYRHPAAQVGVDEELLGLVAASEPQAIVRVWQNRDALVVSGQDIRAPRYTAAVDALADRGVTVVRRGTGGTAVAHIEGILNISWCYFQAPGGKFSIVESYKLLTRPLVEFLATLGIDAYTGEVPGAFCRGRFDVVSGGKKLAGTAQRVKQASDGILVLSHLTLNVSNCLTDSDLQVNTFYELSGLEERIVPGRATSIAEIAGKTGPESLVDAVADQLVEYLQVPELY